MTPPPSQVFLEWQTLNAHPHERSTRWYVVGGIFILMFAAYGLFEGSWLTTIVALLIGGIYFLLRHTQTKTITVRIMGIGVQVEEKVTPWNQIKDFWILLGPTFAELHFASARTFQPEITVFIRDPQTQTSDAPDPGLVRETLLRFLPERAGMQERMLDSIARLLKL